MKRIIAFLLLIATILALVGCGDGDGYQPVESTREEAETVYNIAFGDYDYEVPYELYRAFFLTHKSTVDKGNSAVWSSSDKDKYISEIDTLILDDICEIYSVFALCDSVGIDIYSETVEDSIEEYVIASVEGGSVDNMSVAGYDGDYEKYLESLKERYMNYSVQALLFRYAICSEMLDAYFASTADGGNLAVTEDDVRHFYYNESVRVIKAFYPTATDSDKKINTLETMISIKSGIEQRAENEDAACTYIIGTHHTFGDALRDGYVIGRYNLDESFYSELIDTAFSLDMHEVSDPIQIYAGGSSGYHILYRVATSESNFNSCYEAIESAYVDNHIGKQLHDVRIALISSARATTALIDRDRASISMD